jgi:hypothetical protein
MKIVLIFSSSKLASLLVCFDTFNNAVLFLANSVKKRTYSVQNIKIILEEKKTCRLHRKSPKKSEMTRSHIGPMGRFLSPTIGLAILRSGFLCYTVTMPSCFSS